MFWPSTVLIILSIGKIISLLSKQYEFNLNLFGLVENTATILYARIKI